MYYINKDRLASGRGREELNKNQISALFVGMGGAGKGFRMPSPKRAVGIVAWGAACVGQGLPALRAWRSEAAQRTWREFVFSHRGQQSRKCDALAGNCTGKLGMKWAVGWRCCCKGTVTTRVLLGSGGPLSPSPHPSELQRGRGGTEEEPAPLRLSPRGVNPAVPRKPARFSGQIVLVAPGAGMKEKI